MIISTSNQPLYISTREMKRELRTIPQKKEISIMKKLSRCGRTS